MKGIIFNIFEMYVVDKYGLEFWESIVEAASLTTDDPFVGPGIYPDSDLFALVGEAVKLLAADLPELLKDFGHFMLPKLIQKAPSSVPKDGGVIGFLMGIDDVIHAEVRKLFPDAKVPTIGAELAGDALKMDYSSKRGLCWLMEGLIAGAGDYFKQPLDIRHVKCMHDGAERCEFEIEVVAS